MPHALYWDTEDPYHYVRTAARERGNDFLIVGGEDHKTGQADDQARALGAARSVGARAVPAGGRGAPPLVRAGVRDARRARAHRAAPGRRENVYVITGDSGMGMTHGTLGARLVANLIRGRSTTAGGLYSPSRWMPAALKTLLAENLNLAAQYADWLTGGDVKSADEIPPGQGGDRAARPAEAGGI